MIIWPIIEVRPNIIALILSLFLIFIAYKFSIYSLLCKRRLKGGAGSGIMYGTVKSMSVREMQEMDRRAIEEAGMPSIVLMENAGRSVAEAAGFRKKVAIFCGTGNNGGDGFVAARYLAKKGTKVEVYVVGEMARIKGDARVNLERLQEIGIEIIPSPFLLPIAEGDGEKVRERGDVDLVIDAIFGIGLKGEVKEPARTIIKDLNAKSIPVISVDVPSGLDADTGRVLGEAIKATKTVTMQIAKNGFYRGEGPRYTGEVIVADIGIPEELCAG